METKFIEQLVMTVPESLRETTLALQTEVEELLKAKSTKKFLVLESYFRNTELCRHILRRMEKLPELPSVTSCKIYHRPANSWLQEQRIGQIRRDLKYHYDRLGLDKMLEFGDELIIDGLERDVCAIVLFAHEFYQVTDRPLITQYRAFRIFLVHQFPVLLIMLIECFNQHFG